MADNGSSDSSRRDFLTRTAYVVPGMLTLAATPSFASAGSSGRKGQASSGGKKKNPLKSAKGKGKGPK